MIRRGVIDGWRRARSFWVLALTLHLGNLLITLAAAWIVAWLLDAASGSSLAPRVLTDGYSHTVITDLRNEGFDLRRTAFAVLLVAAPLSVLVNTFLTGGIIATMLPPQSRPTVWVFVASAVAYAGRFLRLLLMGLLLLLPVAVAVALVLLYLVPAIGDGVTTDRTLGEIGSVGLLVIVAAGGVVWMAMDYARVLLIRDRARSSSRSLWRALRLVGVHPLATGTIQLVGFGLLAGTVVLQVIVAVPFAMDSAGGVLSVAVVHQIAVFARAFVRISLIGSQISVTNTVLPARTAGDDSPR